MRKAVKGRESDICCALAAPEGIPALLRPRITASAPQYRGREIIALQFALRGPLPERPRSVFSFSSPAGKGQPFSFFPRPNSASSLCQNPVFAAGCAACAEAAVWAEDTVSAVFITKRTLTFAPSGAPAKLV